MTLLTKFTKDDGLVRPTRKLGILTTSTEILAGREPPFSGWGRATKRNRAKPRAVSNLGLTPVVARTVILLLMPSGTCLSSGWLNRGSRCNIITIFRSVGMIRFSAGDFAFRVYGCLEYKELNPALSPEVERDNGDAYAARSSSTRGSRPVAAFVSRNRVLDRSIVRRQRLLCSIFFSFFGNIVGVAGRFEDRRNSRMYFNPRSSLGLRL